MIGRISVATLCSVVCVAAISALTPAADEAGKRITNSIGMPLVRIEPGAFAMGSPSGGDFDERPVHKVAITRAFYIGATEVTNAQFEKFSPEHRVLRGKLGFSKDDDEAVVFVTWHEASRFCDWLSKMEGRPYRLPTEAEWEYACRAGTATAYSTGDALPKEFQKNTVISWFPNPARSKPAEVVPLAVAKTPPNAWGLFDMHGNVEEWCYDWYEPYPAGDQTDPVGREAGDFRVTRGGSHGTPLEYLRSANRGGTLPEDSSWLIGFRVVQGEMPQIKPLPPLPLPLNRQNVAARPAGDLTKGPDPAKPYFKGPRQYVKIPPGSDGPMFSKHNHDPAIAECPNGDLLAIWYSCRTEPGRELCILASRLRAGAEEWDPASPFWDAPDRNDHAPALWADGKGNLFHFNGLSAAATWGSLATILRVSKDSGATWSRARLIMPEHGLRHMPVESVFQTREGIIVLPCDAVTSGEGGTAIHLSRDGGESWADSGGKTAGIHAGIVQLADGRLMALGRGDNIDNRMPMSISADLGKTWTYSASPFPPISGGQRLAFMRLKEGPLFLASFARDTSVKDAAGRERPCSGIFTALSFDDGKTWPVQRPLTDGAPAHPAQTTDGAPFTMSPTTGEPRGYLSVCQTPDGVVHLISSWNHYAFNLAWLKTPMPAE
jgi:formylglycine-generating enzyme required for sulfatase activity